MLIRIHAITNTPELDAVGPIDESRAAAQAEMHGPRTPGILVSPRRRPIDGRLDSQKRMTRWQGRARRGYGGIHQTGQLWKGRQPPAFLASDIFLDTGTVGHDPPGTRRLRGFFPDQAGLFVQHRVVGEGWQDGKPLRRRRVRTSTACHEHPDKRQRADRDGEKPSSLHHSLFTHMIHAARRVSP